MTAHNSAPPGVFFERFMLSTPVETQLPPPPPSSRVQLYKLPGSQDFLVEHSTSSALVACLQNIVPNSVFALFYLQGQGRPLSWNALHTYLEELIGFAEVSFGMAEHSQRVARIALHCGVALGLGPLALRELYWGGIFHDIGKLVLDQAVLSKASPLTLSEWQVVQQHPQLGSDILTDVFQSDAVAEVARTHHERFDGRGYPHGLSGEAISLPGRIMAVADSFDALTSERRYKAAVDAATALDIIGREAGRQFDPELVEFFLAGDVLYRSKLVVAPPDVG